MSQDEHPVQDDRRRTEAEPEELAPEAPRPVAEPEAAGSQALAGALRSAFLFLRFAIVALIVVYLLTGLFTVKPAEVRFKLRFGQLVKVMRPGDGVQFRWPWEQVTAISTEEKALDLKDDFWPGTEEGGVRELVSLDMRRHGYLITGDMNIIHMKYTARYRARDDVDGAVAYAFAVDEPEEVLRQILRSATCKVVGSMHVMDVIKRQDLFSRIERAARQALADFERRSGVPLGLELSTIVPIEMEKVKNPTEPGAVSDAFFKAQDAASLYDELKQEGQTEAKKILNDAEATKAEILSEAKSYKEHLARSARADAQMLDRLLPLCEGSPTVRRILVQWFYARAVEELMTNSPGAMILRRADGAGSHEIRIELNRQVPERQQGK